jgi:hypothetical protein
MLSGILKVQPFIAEHTSSVYRKIVTMPLMAKTGPAPGAVFRIRELMDKLIVKHQ